ARHPLPALLRSSIGRAGGVVRTDRDEHEHRAPDRDQRAAQRHVHQGRQALAAGAAPRARTGRMTLHALEPTLATLHGHFSRELPPVLTIASADRVRFRTLDVRWGRLEHDTPFE